MGCSIKIEWWAPSLCAALLLAAGCGDDKKTRCDNDAALGEQLQCTCADDSPGTQACDSEGELTPCDCTRGGGNAGSGDKDASAGGSSGSTSSGGSGGSGGSSSNPNDASAMDDGGSSDASMSQDDAGTPPGDEPPTDGSQLAACMDDDECEDGRVCYQPGGEDGDVGYCTDECGNDEDCEALGDEYSCNATGNGQGQGGPGGGNDGACRIECEGSDDDSCPPLMECVQTGQGQFRCAYPQQSSGGGDGALWERCESDDDCMGDLVCYGVFNGGGQGGNENGGFCAQPCESEDDCTEPAPSGDIAPSCGTNACRFDCNDGGECPDGMECVQAGGETARCLYSAE